MYAFANLDVPLSPGVDSEREQNRERERDDAGPDPLGLRH